MANEENLIPGVHALTVEEQSKGGVASGKSRRHKRDLQKTAAWLLSLPLQEGALDPVTSLESVTEKNIAVDEAMMLSLIQKVLNEGDTAAARYLFELSKPTQKNDAKEKKPQNNILQAIFDQSQEDIDTNDIPEIQ